MILLPGLLAAGIGALVFIGIGSNTGVGTLSLAVPNLPAFAHPNGAQFLWALVIGLAAALVGSGIRMLAVRRRPPAGRRPRRACRVLCLARRGRDLGAR